MESATINKNKKDQIQKQFASADISTVLKEIGFNEPCFAYYEGTKFRFHDHESFWNNSDWDDFWKETKAINPKPPTVAIAPLWQQAIAFLKTKGVSVIELPSKLNSWAVSVLNYEKVPGTKREIARDSSFIGAFELEQAILKAINTIKNGKKKKK